MRLLFVFLVFSLGFSSTEKEIASTYTFSSHHSLNEIPLSFEFIGINNNQWFNHVNVLWWPSENLSFNSGISLGNQDDTEIYYHIDFGFSPKWEIADNMSTIFHAGMHRLRFHENEDYRWIHLGLTGSILITNYQIEASFNRLQNENFNHDMGKVNILKSISQQLSLNAGISIDKIQNLNVNPFIGIRVSL